MAKCFERPGKGVLVGDSLITFTGKNVLLRIVNNIVRLLEGGHRIWQFEAFSVLNKH